MAHELRVEGDKVIEQDDKGHVLSTKVSRRVFGVVTSSSGTDYSETGRSTGLHPRSFWLFGYYSQPSCFTRSERGPFELFSPVSLALN